MITANRHARADQDTDPKRFSYQFEREVLKVIAGREEEFTEFVSKLAIDYASRVKEDYETFKEHF